MILYCDTSALMKLFVEEEHSGLMQNVSAASERVVVSMLTWAEMLSALSRKQRTGQVRAAQVVTALEEIEAEWPRYYKLGVDTDLITDAGQLALHHGLRAYDSVQLASAQRIHRSLGNNLIFCCFDKQLNAAAAALAINILPE